MFDRIAEHKGRKTELANAIFLRNFLFFLLFLFNLFLFNDLINRKSCFGVLIFLLDYPSYSLFLGQLVFRTYALF